MAWKLVVLTGRHDGALSPLSGSSVVIGRADDCDIVLTDPGIKDVHAALTLDEQGGLAHPVGDAVVRAYRPTSTRDATEPPQVDQRVAAWSPWAIGDTWVALVPDAFSWGFSEATPPPSAGAAAQQRYRRGDALRIAFGLCLCALLIVMLVNALPRAPLPAESADPAALARRIHALRLPDVKTEVHGHMVSIDGWVDMRAQFERLLEAVDSGGVPVRLHVRIGEEIAARAATFLGPGVTVRYAGAGRLIVSAASTSDDTETEAPDDVARRLAQLRADLGHVAQIEADLPMRPAPPATQPLPVQIVEVQADDPPHFRTADGVRYFIGARLPDGAEVAHIATDRVVFRHGGRLVPYRLLE